MSPELLTKRKYKKLIKLDEETKITLMDEGDTEAKSQPNRV